MNPSDTSDFVLLGPSHSFASHHIVSPAELLGCRLLFWKLTGYMLFLCWTCRHLRGFGQHNITVKWRAVVSWAESQRRSSRTSPLHQTPTAPPLGGGPTGVHQAFFRLSPAVALGWDPGDLVLGGVHCTLDILVITGSHTEAETNVCWALNWTLLHYRNSDGAFSKHWGCWIEEHFCIIIFHLPPLSFSTLSLHFRGQHFHLVQTPARWPSVNPLMHNGPTANSLLWLIDIKKILFLPPQHLDDNYYQWPHKPQIYYGLLYVFTAGL